MSTKEFTQKDLDDFKRGLTEYVYGLIDQGIMKDSVEFKYHKSGCEVHAHLPCCDSIEINSTEIT